MVRLGIAIKSIIAIIVDANGNRYIFYKKMFSDDKFQKMDRIIAETINAVTKLKLTLDEDEEKKENEKA